MRRNTVSKRVREAGLGRARAPRLDTAEILQRYQAGHSIRDVAAGVGASSSALGRHPAALAERLRTQPPRSSPKPPVVRYPFIRPLSIGERGHRSPSDDAEIPPARAASMISGCPRRQVTLRLTRTSFQLPRSRTSRFR